MNTQLHTVGSIIKDEGTTTTNDQQFEEIYIKEEPLETTSHDHEYYENVLQSVKKEECISDNDEQIDETSDNPITINNDIGKTENINSIGFCCAKCNRSFTLKSNLNRHIQTHNEEKEFQCNICNKHFGQKRLLSDHLKIHMGIKKFQCPTCEKSFLRKVTLDTHMQLHTGERKFQCPICHNYFSSRSYLNLHNKIHTGERDYMCNVCKKCFLTNGKLQRHMKIHSGSKNKTIEIR